MKIVQVGTNKAYDELSEYLISNYDEIDFGLFVEPNILHLEDIKKCYEKYSNIIIENVAIKPPTESKDNIKIYYHTNDGPYYALASCDVNHIVNHLWCPHLHVNGEGKIESFDVSCITLEQLFDKYNIYDLDWLYLDIEGIDADILLTFNWEKYNIKRIEFEKLHLGDYTQSIKNMMIGMGYTQVDSLHEYDWAFENKNIVFDDDNIKNSLTYKVSDNKSKNLKILFLGRNNSNEVWEYDFIMNDLLPEDIDKTPHFMFLDDVRNTTETFDIFVYSARDPNNYPWGWMPTYDEALECVLKTKPRIIIQLSDEFQHEDLQIHNELGNYCELFLRQHHHQNYHYTNNTLHIPLAYINGFKVDTENILKISDRKINWSLIGVNKSDRMECIRNFLNIENFFINLTYEGGYSVAREEIFKIYRETIFCPSTRGWTTIYGNRAFEASISGSIPVVVAPKEEVEYVFKYEENPPWIFTESWEEASNVCKNLLNDKDQLQRMQDSILRWWDNRVFKIKNKIEECLFTDIISKKLNNFPSINFISIEESQDRRDLLYENFEKYGITNVTPHIYRRYNDEEHKIIDGPLILLPEGRGPVTSHLKAIREWYENTDEPYTFMCEDDLSFDSVKYWNFTWDEFFNKLPEDWGCVQLCLVSSDVFLYYQTNVKMRHRCFDDWSGCAYLISRKHAKNLIDNYYSDDSFHLEYKGSDWEYRVGMESAYWFLLPQIENMIYSQFSGYSIYTFPLFLENAKLFKTTWSEGADNWINRNSYDEILNWWKEKGKNMKIDELILF